MNKIFRFIQRHAPTILASAGVVGTIGTAILSARGHAKAVDIVRELEKKEDKPLTFKEKAKATWKQYAPAVGTGVVTIACIVTGNRIAAKEIAVLSASAGFLLKNRDQLRAKYEELKSKVVEKAEEKGISSAELGLEDKDRDVNEYYEKYKQRGHSSWEYTGDGTMRCIDLYSGRCFLSSPEAVRKAGEELNKMFECDSAVCMSDWYELLGIRKTTFGYQYGWPMNTDYFEGPIHFEYDEELDDDGMPILFIDIWTPPMDGWAEL